MDPAELFPWLAGAGVGLTVAIVIVSLVLSVLCTVVPIGGVVWFIVRRSRQAGSARAASQSWPAVAGRVLKSRVEVSGGEHTTVSPRVVYEYYVGSARYENDQVRAGDRFMSSYSGREAYDVVDRYAVDSTVTVFYNPANPAESALER